MRPLRRAAEGAAELAEAVLGHLGPDFAQGRVVTETAHREWPLPASPWLMAQSWTDLLFAHWPVLNEALRVPEPLELDTFEETAWLGITPFEVRGVRLRGTAPLPRLSRFPELNVRTYVRFDERPGIWFFSLDAGSAAAVAAARASYHLPYHHARAAISRTGDGIRYRSTRTSGDAELDVSYSPTGAARHPPAGTLEHWLTERYCLYAFDPRGRLLRAEVHHPPWPLQPATAAVAANTMAPAGVELPHQEPLLHFARRQDVVIWPPERLT